MSQPTQHNLTQLKPTMQHWHSNLQEGILLQCNITRSNTTNYNPMMRNTIRHKARRVDQALYHNKTMQYCKL